MNHAESAVHPELTTALIYGSIFLVLILLAFNWWLDYSYKKREKKNHKTHLDHANPSQKMHRQRRHKKPHRK